MGMIVKIRWEKCFVEQFPIQVKINSIDTDMQAILLAAGHGTRLRPYTNIRPKPLFPICNRPLLHRLLAQLRACDCFAHVSHHESFDGMTDTSSWLPRGVL